MGERGGLLRWGRGWEVVRHSGSNTRAKDEYPPLSPTERPLTPLFSEILALTS